MLCQPHKHRGNGDAERTPFKELKKIGIKRRYSRNKTYSDD